MDTEFGRRALDHVRGVHMRVADELATVPAGLTVFARSAGLTVLARSDQQMNGRRVAAMAEVQHYVFGQRVGAVSIARRASECEHVRHLGRAEMVSADKLGARIPHARHGSRLGAALDAR